MMLSVMYYLPVSSICYKNQSDIKITHTLAYLSAYLSIHQSSYLPIFYLSACLSIYLLSVSLYVYHLSIHPSIHPRTHPSLFCFGDCLFAAQTGFKPQKSSAVRLLEARIIGMSNHGQVYV